MKKFISIFMLIFALMLTAACGNTSASTDSQAGQSAGTAKSSSDSAQQNDSNSKILVLYFSCTGNTKTLAENAASVLHADLQEIVPEQKYTTQDLNYNDETTRATVEQKDNNARPKIKGKINNLEKYDTIILAYPIWWGQAPRIIDTLMEDYNFADKTIVPICTSGGSEIGTSVESLKLIGSGGAAKWTEGKRFDSSASKDELQKFFSGQHVSAAQ